MRLLVVDVGNTSTAAGMWCGGAVSRVKHVDGGLLKSPVAMRAALASILGTKGADALAYLSVVPGADGAWRTQAKALGLPFIKITCKAVDALGTFALDYPKPETIGVDRLADAAAAVDLYGAPAIVCDFGTAFTAAVITADRQWRGGAIAPGFPLMRDYLFERTAQLPRMRLGGKCPVIGRSTEEAMRFGAIVGYRGMVREIVATLEKNFGGGFKLVATGGFAGWALDGIGMDFALAPTLTLHGAGLLAEALAGARKEERGIS